MKEEEEKNRMLELLEGFSKTNEIYKKEKEQIINENELNKVYQKMQNNAFDKNLNEMRFGNASIGAGETVNSIIKNQDTTKYSMYGMNHDVKPAVSSGLHPNEAFEIAIKRTVDSGDPINNITFYDEVNWNLEKMGFRAKSAIDIKSALGEIMKYGEIRN